MPAGGPPQAAGAGYNGRPQYGFNPMPENNNNNNKGPAIVLLCPIVREDSDVDSGDEDGSEIIDKLNCKLLQAEAVDPDLDVEFVARIISSNRFDDILDPVCSPLR